ncbi:MAG: NAD(P)-binding domain-containing protein [Actinobacteria bacterium]|nr:NAD(P)-binding domain-containing protein [Actinomycetota bacterium]
MKIAVIGKGNVGGGLAQRWRAAGHEVTEIGRGGGAADEAEAVLLAVPSAEIEDALRGVSGVEGKTVLDATNHLQGERPDFPSLAHQVKSITGGPVAKAFNLNFASIYDEIDAQATTPSCLYCADDEARPLTEQLIRDSGYEPVSAGGLESARALEETLGVLFAVMSTGGGPVFYRFGKPGEL